MEWDIPTRRIVRKIVEVISRYGGADGVTPEQLLAEMGGLCRDNFQRGLEDAFYNCVVERSVSGKIILNSESVGHFFEMGYFWAKPSPSFDFMTPRPPVQGPAPMNRPTFVPPYQFSNASPLSNAGRSNFLGPRAPVKGPAPFSPQAVAQPNFTRPPRPPAPCNAPMKRTAPNLPDRAKPIPNLGKMNRPVVGKKKISDVDRAATLSSKRALRLQRMKMTMQNIVYIDLTEPDGETVRKTEKPEKNSALTKGRSVKTGSEKTNVSPASVPVKQEPGSETGKEAVAAKPESGDVGFICRPIKEEPFSVKTTAPNGAPSGSVKQEPSAEATTGGSAPAQDTGASAATGSESAKQRAGSVEKRKIAPTEPAACPVKANPQFGKQETGPEETKYTAQSQNASPAVGTSNIKNEQSCVEKNSVGARPDITVPSAKAMRRAKNKLLRLVKMKTSVGGRPVAAAPSAKAFRRARKKQLKLKKMNCFARAKNITPNLNTLHVFKTQQLTLRKIEAYRNTACPVNIFENRRLSSEEERYTDTTQNTFLSRNVFCKFKKRKFSFEEDTNDSSRSVISVCKYKKRKVSFLDEKSNSVRTKSRSVLRVSKYERSKLAFEGGSGEGPVQKGARSVSVVSKSGRGKVSATEAWRRRLVQGPCDSEDIRGATNGIRTANSPPDGVVRPVEEEEPLSSRMTRNSIFSRDGTTPTDSCMRNILPLKVTVYLQKVN